MILVWVVIPLLLIGIIGIQELFAEQSSGKPAWVTNSDKVCGDRLCSEVDESFTNEKTWKLSEFIDSPKQQMKNGILPSEVECKVGLVPILKSSDNLPVCVKPQTAKKLIERGWATEESQVAIQLEQNIQNQIIQTIPASSGITVNFYVNDDDLNTSPNGIDIISTSELIEITINGIMIDAPKKMIETSPNSGKFFLEIELPETINEKPLDQNDIFLIKYIDESDASGEKRIISSYQNICQTSNI